MQYVVCSVQLCRCLLLQVFGADRKPFHKNCIGCQVLPNSQLTVETIVYIVCLTVQCTVYSTLYTVHCTLYKVHCTQYTVYFTLHTAHFTLYTVHNHLQVSGCPNQLTAKSLRRSSSAMYGR